MTLRAWDAARLALSAAGVGVMVYLTVVHYSAMDLLACPSSGVVNCETVLTSTASEFYGVPITIIGGLWFVIAGAFAVASLLSRRGEVPWLTTASLLWAVAGTLSVLYLVYVEVVDLRALCLWCTVAHLCIGALLVIGVLTQPNRGPISPNAAATEE